MAVRRTPRQKSGSSPSPWSCALSILTQSRPGVYTPTRPDTPKQIPAFDALHELQPMAIRDQPVGLNICARAQAAHCAFCVGYRERSH